MAGRRTLNVPPTTNETGIGPVGAAHVPVMLGEVVEWLRPRPGARLVDATVGLGGHAAALLGAAPDTSLLGLDRDPEALARARERLRAEGDRVDLRQANFADAAAILADKGWDAADAVLLDLGVSSLQLDTAERGFAFQREGPLDMRMDPSAPLTAAEIVNRWPEARLARLIAECGEERRARAVARAIGRARPLRTTGHLAAVVSGVLGAGRAGIHPATRTFPALRIRRPLVRPSADAARVLRLVRGLPRHVLVLGAFLVVLCVARVWLRLDTVNLGYELSSARQMQLRLEHERQELEVEIATLRDPARIADIARRRLGMRDPEKGQVVVLP